MAEPKQKRERVTLDELEKEKLTKDTIKAIAQVEIEVTFFRQVKKITGICIKLKDVWFLYEESRNQQN